MKKMTKCVKVARVWLGCAAELAKLVFYLVRAGVL